ncbi:MAG TPA: hypothetical protein VKV17_15215 [Bryobacteraceae bacterium]|nr:hypothetical protein [Bryobacteraceae bacterium]
MISATAYDRHVEQLFEALRRVTNALRAARIERRVIGGVDFSPPVEAAEGVLLAPVRDLVRMKLVR